MCPERAGSTPSVTDGAALIAAERRRQVESEGWTPEHDDEHDTGGLADAGACYALCAAGQTRFLYATATGMPAQWPWAREWWKPSDDRIHNLVRAGALIAAEIDRLHRAGVSGPSTTGQNGGTHSDRLGPDEAACSYDAHDA